MPLPRNSDGKLDYDELDWFFKKHNSFENFGPNEEILPELEKEDYELFKHYRDYLFGLLGCRRILESKTE